MGAKRLTHRGRRQHSDEFGELQTIVTHRLPIKLSFCTTRATTDSANPTCLLPDTSWVGGEEKGLGFPISASLRLHTGYLFGAQNHGELESRVRETWMGPVSDVRNVLISINSLHPNYRAADSRMAGWSARPLEIFRLSSPGRNSPAYARAYTEGMISAYAHSLTWPRSRDKSK